MPKDDSDRPPFVVRLRIFVSDYFPDYEERVSIGWNKFFRSSEPDTARTPVELACKAFIDLMLSPEVADGGNDLPVRIMTCLFAYLCDQYKKAVPPDRASELGKLWTRYQAGASPGTADMRGWFAKMYADVPWPTG